MPGVYQIFTLVLCVVASALLGCQTSERQALSCSEPASDIVRFSGPPPVWIFMPSPSITDYSSGYPAEIALRHRGYTTNFIEVRVDGEVVSRGRIRLPAGSSVLQAISCAGGFNAFAFTTRLVIGSQSGKQVILYQHSRRPVHSLFSEVWYDTSKDVRGKSQSPRNASEDLPSDYILEDGDEVHVQRTVM